MYMLCSGIGCLILGLGTVISGYWVHIIVCIVATWVLFRIAIIVLRVATRIFRFVRSKIKGSSKFTRTVDTLFGVEKEIAGQTVEVLGIIPAILAYIVAVKHRVCPIVKFVELEDFVEGRHLPA